MKQNLDLELDLAGSCSAESAVASAPSDSFTSAAISATAPAARAQSRRAIVRLAVARVASDCDQQCLAENVELTITSMIAACAVYANAARSCAQQSCIHRSVAVPFLLGPGTSPDNDSASSNCSFACDSWPETARKRVNRRCRSTRDAAEAGLVCADACLIVWVKTWIARDCLPSWPYSAASWPEVRT